MRKYEIVILSKGAFARTVRIYNPKKADRAIIMHDGQNAFFDEEAAFKKSWRAIEILKSNKITDTAIIGIDSVDATRNNDYLPFPIELTENGAEQGGGNADEYCDYLEQTVIPYLDKRFGFKFYAVLGSSAGALATLHCASRQNSRIRAYGMFSTPLFVCKSAYADFFKTAKFDVDAFYHIYSGGSEAVGDYSDPEILKSVPDMFVDDAFALTKALRSSGAKNIALEINNTSVHDEVSWRAPESRFMSEFAKL